VFLECGATFWWQGAAEMAQLLRDIFPEAQLILTGAYALCATEHAQQNTGAIILSKEATQSLFLLPATLDVCEHKPPVLHILFGNGQRTADEIVNEIMAAKTKTRGFLLSDEKIVERFPELFKTVLEQLIERKAKVKLFTAGNIGYKDLCKHPELPNLMRQAGYKQINFADDRDQPFDGVSQDVFVEDAIQAVQECVRAGFKLRTDELTAGICLGKPNENLTERTKMATLLAHHVGALIVWAYQPEAHECPDLPLQAQNGKLFPLQEQNGYRHEDYLEFLGLAAILNAKYRGQTFDFMGESFMSKKFRESVGRQSWNPDPEVKGNVNPLSRRK
jgi:hypothetical protein